MSGIAKVLLVLIGAAVGGSIANAQAPATAFDGQYGGVSAQVSKANQSIPKCPGERTPDALSIAGGTINSSGASRWTGTVSSQGVVVVRNRLHQLVNGNIDAQGTLTGEYHGPACNVTYVWRKQ
jgi:hypothetical protein